MEGDRQLFSRKVKQERVRKVEWWNSYRGKARWLKGKGLMKK
jgi:hypothetical protein